MPEALAKSFDAKVLHGTSPGAGHDVISDATAAVFGTTDAEFADLIAVRGGVAGANGRVDGWIVSPAMENTLYGVLDGNGRQLLVPGTTSGAVADRKSVV